MESQKMINLLDDATNQNLNSEQDIGLRLTMSQKEDMIILILDLNQPQ